MYGRQLELKPIDLFTCAVILCKRHSVPKCKNVPVYNLKNTGKMDTLNYISVIKQQLLMVKTCQFTTK